MLVSDFNYDLPEEAESYIHRIGRAGRAGETGEAISFCSRDELGALYDIEILIKREISEEETEWTIEVTRLEKHKSSRNNNTSRMCTNRRTSMLCSW